MLARNLPILALVYVVFTGVACASSDTEESCTNLMERFEGCPSDYMGSWEIFKTCATGEIGYFSDCEEATYDAYLNFSGVAHFDETHMTLDFPNHDVVIDAVVPKSCSAFNCSQIQDLINVAKDAVAECRDTPETCECHVVGTIDIVPGEPLPYDEKDNKLVENIEGTEKNIPIIIEYCREGNVLNGRAILILEGGMLNGDFMFSAKKI